MKRLRRMYAFLRLRYLAYIAKDEVSFIRLLDLAEEALNIAAANQIYPPRRIKEDLYQQLGKTDILRLKKYLHTLSGIEDDAIPMMLPATDNYWDRDKWGYYPLDSQDIVVADILLPMSKAVVQAKAALVLSKHAASYKENRTRNASSDLRYLIIWLAER